jgi:5-methylcytosine-specific restriction endonuclease McrA
VVEGGGECDPENIRTLCLKCHRAATARLRAKRANSASASGSA